MKVVVDVDTDKVVGIHLAAGQAVEIMQVNPGGGNGVERERGGRTDKLHVMPGEGGGEGRGGRGERKEGGRRAGGQQGEI